MSEVNATNLGTMLRKPGTVFELGDLRRLHEFEDIIAPEVDSAMTPSQLQHWQSRVVIAGQLRPPKFNGNINNVVLEVMKDPVARLFDAKERGYALDGAGGQHVVNRTRNAETVERWRSLGMGFTLLADATSSRRKDMGQIRAELWYFPVGLMSKVIQGKTYERKNVNRTAGMPIRRWTTKPVYDTERFVRLQEDARPVGFLTLQKAMSRPLPTGMHM